MTRAGWVAILAAIAFPSIALIVVVTTRQDPPLTAAPQIDGDWRPPPPGPHGRKGPPPSLRAELQRLRGPLALTDEQMAELEEVVAPVKGRVDELQSQIQARETTLQKVLDSEDVCKGAGGKFPQT